MKTLIFLYKTRRHQGLHMNQFEDPSSEEKKGKKKYIYLDKQANKGPSV